jgi:hypothetical protein
MYQLSPLMGINQLTVFHCGKGFDYVVLTPSASCLALGYYNTIRVEITFNDIVIPVIVMNERLVILSPFASKYLYQTDIRVIGRVKECEECNNDIEFNAFAKTNHIVETGVDKSSDLFPYDKYHDAGIIR